MDFFIRKLKLYIEGLSIEENRVKFKVEKSLVGFPNLAQIDIYNLNENERNQLSKNQTVELYAGYEENMPLAFKGQIRNIQNQYIKPDWITTLYCADGAVALENSTINQTFPAGTGIEAMFNAAVGQLDGISKGVIDGVKECLTKKQSILKTIITSTSVKDFLDRLSETCGFDYSINDEVIETTQKGKALSDDPDFIVNQKTGMIGNPEVTEIGADATVYLRSYLKLGRKFKIESISETINVGNQFFRNVNKTTANAVYRINKITHEGDTHDNDWKSTLVGQSL